MNCHNENSHNHKKGQTSHRWHKHLMVLCSAISIALILGMSNIQINNPFLKSILPVAALAICHIMYIVMMRMMIFRNKDDKEMPKIEQFKVRRENI